MKLISWNVNGIRACVGKGFLDFFQQIDADFFCLQETKMQPGQLDLDLPGYYQYWNSAEKKGYSGTAIFSRIEPLQVSYGLPQDSHNHEGRVITLELEQFYLVTVYTPNSQDQLAVWITACSGRTIFAPICRSWTPKSLWLSAVI